MVSITDDLHSKNDNRALDNEIFSSNFDNHDIMPRLGFGTAGIQGNTKSLVCNALSYGYKLIDTAQAIEWYSEEDLGYALEECYSNKKNMNNINNDLMIVTKIHPRTYKFDEMMISLQRSKLNIYRSYYKSHESMKLDVVLLHSPSCWEGHCNQEQQSITWQEAWNNLIIAYQRNLVKFIGVSNFDINLLKQAVEITENKNKNKDKDDHHTTGKVSLSVIQNWMDPFHQDRKVRDYCILNNITYMAYSTLGTQWQWKLKYNPVFESNILKEIANDHNKNNHGNHKITKISVSDVVLAWALQVGVVVIPRSSKAYHIKSNAKFIQNHYDYDNSNSSSSGSSSLILSDEEMTRIRDLDGSLGQLW